MALSEEFAAEITDAVEAIEVAKDVADDAAADGAVDSAAVVDNVVTDDVITDDTVVADVVVNDDVADDVVADVVVDDELGTDLIVAPTISDDVLSQAVLAGISISDARGFPSDDALLHIVKVIQDAKRIEKEAVADVDAEDPLDNLPTLDPETYGVEAVEMFDKLAAVVRSQRDTINEFQSNQRSAEQASLDANAHEVTQWFDKQVNDLGEDFTEALGTGSFGDQPQGSSQQAKRDQVAGQLAVLMAGYKDTGIPLPPRDELFRAATRVVLHDEFAKIDAKKLSGKLAKRSSQYSQRAGGIAKKGSPSSVDDIAAELDEKFFKKVSGA